MATTGTPSPSCAALVEFVHAIQHGELTDAPAPTRVAPAPATVLTAPAVYAAVVRFAGDLDREAPPPPVASSGALLAMARARLRCLAADVVGAPDPNDTPEAVAEALFCRACKSRLKQRVVAWVTTLDPDDQGDLMAIVKRADLHDVEADDGPARHDVALERVASRLTIAEDCAADWRAQYEACWAARQADQDGHQADVKRLRERLLAAQDDLDAARGELEHVAALRAQLAALEAQLDGVDDLQERLEASERDLRASRQALADLDGRCASYRAQVARLDAYRAAAAEQSAAVVQAQAQAAAAQRQVEALEHELQGALRDNRLLKESVQRAPPPGERQQQQRSLHDDLDSDERRPPAVDVAAPPAVDEDDEARTLREDLALERERSAALGGKVRDLEAELADAVRRQATIRAENTSLRELLDDDTSKGKRDLEDDVVRLRADLHQKQVELETLDREGAGERVRSRQELQLVVSAMYNLTLEYQQRVLNPQAHPETITCRPRRQRRPDQR